MRIYLEEQDRIYLHAPGGRVFEVGIAEAPDEGSYPELVLSSYGSPVTFNVWHGDGGGKVGDLTGRNCFIPLTPVEPAEPAQKPSPEDLAKELADLRQLVVAIANKMGVKSKMGVKP